MSDSTNSEMGQEGSITPTGSTITPEQAAARQQASAPKADPAMFREMYRLQEAFLEKMEQSAAKDRKELQSIAASSDDTDAQILEALNRLSGKEKGSGTRKTGGMQADLSFNAERNRQKRAEARQKFEKKEEEKRAQRLRIYGDDEAGQQKADKREKADRKYQGQSGIFMDMLGLSNGMPKIFQDIQDVGDQIGATTNFLRNVGDFFRDPGESASAVGSVGPDLSAQGVESIQQDAGISPTRVLPEIPETAEEVIEEQAREVRQTREVDSFDMNPVTAPRVRAEDGPAEPIHDLSDALQSVEGKEEVADLWGRFLFAAPDEDLLASLTNIEGYKPLLAMDEDELGSLADSIAAIRDAFVIDGSTSMLDTDASTSFKTIADGASVIMKAFGDDPAAAEQASEAFGNFFTRAGDIPEEAIENLDSLAGTMIKAAIGLAAMAGALFIVAAIPMPDAAIGLTGVALAATILGVAGQAAPQIMDGGMALGVAAVGLGLIAYSMQYVADIDPLPALAGLGVIAVAGVVAGVAGLASSFIMAGALALALLAPPMYLMGWAMDAVASIDGEAALSGLEVIAAASLVGATAGLMSPAI
ncbi:MAG: hypothetical protein LC650_03730, partial [Actinobacteria bacterium]|nr:hypothetical protein [Actinomycetota bacterium]